MIWVLLFAVVVVVLGGPAHRFLVRVSRRTPVARPDPVLLARLAVEHPMAQRPRYVDAFGPWTVADGVDELEYQALLAEVMAATRAPGGS